MGKATSIYFFMSLVFGIGLWAILTLGRSVRAPEDLSGKWLLDGNRAMTVDQSGQFFEFRISNMPALSMRLIPVTVSNTNPQRPMKLTLQGPGTSMLITSDNSRKRFRFDLIGPQSGSWLGERLVETQGTSEIAR